MKISSRLIQFIALLSLLTGCNNSSNLNIDEQKVGQTVQLQSQTPANQKSEAPSEGKILEDEHSIVYLPSGTNEQGKYTTIFVFSPIASAEGSIKFWKSHSEKHKWLIYASKDYKNDIFKSNAEAEHFCKTIKNQIDEAANKFPIDKKRLIFTGLSGGGSFSHALNINYPGTAAALIINTGRIWDDSYQKASSNISSLRSKYSKSKKIIVFLASPTDFRYQEMQRDRVLMNKLGWRVKWIEFEGGHKFAPTEDYEKAINWIESQPNW